MKKRITMILGLVCLSTLTACSNSENVKEKNIRRTSNSSKRSGNNKGAQWGGLLSRKIPQTC